MMFDYFGAELKTRIAIASADDTPADVLIQLSEDSAEEVRSAVASNPNTSTEVLLKLGEEFPEAITANPIFNLLLLENPNSKFIRLSLARSSTTSPETLARLWETYDSYDEEICCAIARNPKTPSELLHKLVLDNFEEDYILEEVAKHKNTSPSTLHILVNFLSAGNVIQAVAKNPNTPTSTLEFLAGENSSEIRQAVLEHPNVSTTAIEIISFMEKKPGTPIHILEKLATDPRCHVRELVAKDPNTPANALEKLAEKESIKTNLHSIIFHPNASSRLLEKLTHRLVDRFNFGNNIRFNNDDTQTLLNLINHPCITPYALEQLASLKCYETMVAIANHPNPPPNVLTKKYQEDIHQALVNKPQTFRSSLRDYDLDDIPF